MLKAHREHHAGHKTIANHSHNHQNSAMDKVKIKRIKRNKKKVSTEEKIVAGLGVGATLLGGVGGLNSQPKQPTQFVRTQSSDTSSTNSKIKSALENIFGVPEAQASTLSTLQQEWNQEALDSQKGIDDSNPATASAAYNALVSGQTTSSGTTQTPAPATVTPTPAATANSTAAPVTAPAASTSPTIPSTFNANNLDAAQQAAKLAIATGKNADGSPVTDYNALYNIYYGNTTPSAPATPAAPAATVAPLPRTFRLSPLRRFPRHLPPVRLL